MKHLLVLLTVVPLLVNHGNRADADIVVEFGSAQIRSGGSGFIDVFVSSSDGSDELFGFEADFSLLGDNTGGFLEFKPSFNPANPTGPDTQSSAETQDPDYVFRGDSTSFSATRNGPPNQMIQSDFASANKPLGSDRFLLARLDFFHITPVPVNTVFSVALNPTGNTNFYHDDLSTASIDAVSFTNLGSINVTAIPEPSSLLVLAMVFGGVAVRRRRKTLLPVRSESKC
ncbi:PEP-CTERM sorting domain-containing protein [Stieleria sp. TO1_6]|uniref:PEP-CTERM sorting domain-containing protein n=1 Tax=Stieleria tagensis TaxID=2956795 RepID=UPI00209AC8A9|nr:PEP-CTERM sorting domain-containing protein [Stieleria tagensis]MCO8123491.1 PEP-CTERM sorting domain-containing protein [Stieleria tagensis]